MLRRLIRKTAIRAIDHLARFLPAWTYAKVVDVVPQIEWVRVKSPVNVSELPTQFASQFVRAKNIPARRVFQLQNTCVTAEGVTFRNLRVFIPSLPWRKDLQRYQSGHFLSVQWKRSLRSVDTQPVILGFDRWAMSNYYHWMIEALPRLYVAQSLYKGCRILLPEDVHEFVITSLKLLGIENLLRIGSDETIRVPHLIMPEIVYYNGVENEDEPPAAPKSVDVRHPFASEELILHVRRKLLDNFSATKPFRKIYVSRSRSRIRKLVNEKDIVRALTASGFEIVFFEGMSLIEQIRLMQETSVFVGVHGSNMVNILFLPNTAKIIELMNEHKLNDAFYLVASTLGLDYYSVPCRMQDQSLQTSNDSVLINDADLVVEVDRFEEVLHKMFPSSSVPATLKTSNIQHQPF